MIAIIFAAADKNQAEAEYVVFSKVKGRTVRFRTDGKMVDYFSYLRADDGLAPVIESFSVSPPDGEKMYVIYAVFDDAV